jgi:hypothetical protein
MRGVAGLQVGEDALGQTGAQIADDLLGQHLQAVHDRDDDGPMYLQHHNWKSYPLGLGTLPTAAAHRQLRQLTGGHRCSCSRAP